MPQLYARNPHELMRIHEVLDILTVAKIVLYASLARKSSSAPLSFMRSDYPEMDPERDRRHIAIRQENGKVLTRSVPLDFFGDLKEEYEKHNEDEIREREPEADYKTAAAPVRKELGVSGETKPREFSVEQEHCSARPVIYHPEKCIGCGSCAAVCQCDVLYPAKEKGKPPIVMYPGECYYCGACVMACKVPGAIELKHPLMNRAKFVPVKKSEN